MKCVIFGSVGPQTARFDLSGVPVRGTLFLFAALVRIRSAQSRHPASWCRYPAYPGGRWPTSGRQARHRLPDPSLARVRKTGSHWLPVLFMALSLCAGSVQRNPGILPVSADTRLIRAGAGRIKVRSRLSELAQFSAIQASCQLVPIPGSYWVALADHWLHQPR